MKPNVWLYMFEGFAEFEMAPVSSLLQIYCNINTFATRKREIHSESGWTVKPDASIGDVHADEVDAIIIPGGDMAPNVDQTELFSLVKKVHHSNGVVASICSGAFILNEAEVLKDIPYTATLKKEQRTFLGFNEEHFIYQPVVESGRVITAQGHASFPFAIAVALGLGLPVTDAQKQFYLGLENPLMLEEV